MSTRIYDTREENDFGIMGDFAMWKFYGGVIRGSCIGLAINGEQIEIPLRTFEELIKRFNKNND